MNMQVIGEVRSATGSPWREKFFGINPNKTLKRVIVWAVMATIAFHEFILPVEIDGSSMTPTYTNGSLNLINRVCYYREEPACGDVIALKLDNELLLKRIVAGPGQTVSLAEGTLYVNGYPIQDKFSKEKVPYDMGAVHLDQDEYFVIGDNRANTIFGKITRQQIVGRVLF
jgi:signal peptidase I